MSFKVHAFAITIVLSLMCTLGVGFIALQQQPKVLDVRLTQIPMQVASLVATELHFDDSVYSALQADGNILRDYEGSDGNVINLYIGYYGTARGGRAEHLPQYCFTGQGWTIEKWDFTTINVPDREMFRVNRMIVNKGGMRQLVYFWFQSEGTAMSTGWEQNWYKFQHRLQSRRNDGTLVRVSSPLPSGKEREVEDRTQQFAAYLIPQISQYWPLEGDVVAL